MKKSLLACALIGAVSLSAMASEAISAYDLLKAAVSRGQRVTVTVDQEKCEGLSSPHHATFTPHAVMMAANMMSITENVLTNLDPNAKGKLAYEMVNYFILPYGGELPNYDCDNLEGCVMIKTTAYEYASGKVLTSYADSYCDVGWAVHFFV